METLFARWGSRCAILGAAFFAAACGGGSSGTMGTGGASTTGTGKGGTGTGPTAIACTGQPASLSLSGTWAAYGQLSVKLQGVPGGAITICPADQVGAATMLLLLDVQQDTTDPTKLSKMTATLCSIELPTVTALVGTCDPASDSLVTSQIIAPQTFLDALPKVANATATGSLGGTAPGSTITVNPFDVVVGSSKSGSALPAWNTSDSACNATGLGTAKMCESMCVADCASTRDDDADGYPGVTVEVCGQTSSDTKKGLKCNASSPSTPGVSLQGQAYIDIEVDPTFTGTAKSSCEVTGNVDSKVLYNLVGANVYLGPGQIGVSSAIESLPTFQVDPSSSKFRMVRIDGQYGAPNWSVDPTQPAAACQTLNMHVNEL